MDKNKEPSLSYTNLSFTSDLALAAAISLFYPIKSINRNNPQKVYFLFQKEKNLDSIIERYRQGKLKVDAKSYFTNLKMIKNLIYESHNYKESNQ